MFTQICLGLHSIHTKHEIIHRDLKPDNILIDNHGIVKIGDFGLSRIMPETLVQASNIKGTLGYLPLEYIQAGLVHNKTDIFSLGVILYQLCALKRPFEVDAGISQIAYIEALGKERKALPNIYS